MILRHRQLGELISLPGPGREFRGVYGASPMNSMLRHGCVPSFFEGSSCCDVKGKPTAKPTVKGTRRPPSPPTSKETHRFRAFHVEQFLQKVSAAHRKAQRALAVAESTAQSRTVRNTRVFLCTIPSGYKAGPEEETKHGGVGRGFV